MEIELLYFEDCPNWEVTAAHLDTLAEDFPDLELSRHLVDTEEEAQRVQFRGSPSIIVDGVDVFAPDDAPVGLSCRMYQTPNGPAGSPTLEQLRDVITERQSA